MNKLFRYSLLPNIGLRKFNIGSFVSKEQY